MNFSLEYANKMMQRQDGNLDLGGLPIQKHPENSKGYAVTNEQIQPEARYNVELIATYEEIMKIPSDEQITANFGDDGLHHFKQGVTEKEIRLVYEKALAAIEMTEEEFNARRSLCAYRDEIIGRMRECLLPSVLETGKEYLFVATLPYYSDDDFWLRGSILLGVDTEKRTCTMRGEFFMMEDVPIRYILAKYNREVTGEHYGFREAEPLFGEYPTLARQYLEEVEKSFHEKFIFRKK